MEALAPLAISVEETGKELGRGVCSRIVEVLYGGVRCKAKKLDGLPSDSVNREKLSDACLLLSRLRHPHIAQFLGTQAIADGTLSIVSEHLPSSLAWALERYGSLPELLTHSILRDVSAALTYLHAQTTPVAHGHLVPNNVLLTADFTAKLSDVGVARSVYLLGELPRESAVYVPPSENGSVEGDIFSLGAIMVHAIGGKHPASLVSASNKPLHTSLGVAERHPLCSLMKDCLQPDAAQRPTAPQVLNTISLETTKFSGVTVESRLSLIQGMKGGSNHPLTISRRISFSPKQSLRGRPDDQNMALIIECESLKLQVEELKVVNRGLRTSLERQMKVVSARDHEMAAKLMAKDQEILAKQQEVAAKEAQLQAAEDSLAAKEATGRGLVEQLNRLQEYLASQSEVSLLFYSTANRIEDTSA